MTAPSRSERFAGCLVGQAVGDAMGFVVEGRSPQVCSRYVQAVLAPFHLEGVGRAGMALGQYSDDTQLARELTRSLIEREGFDPADYAGRIGAIFAEGAIVGRGRATEEAALRLARGVPWNEAGTPGPSAGNGSAMRAAPVGLLFLHDHAALARAAHDQGRITHTDPRCSAGAIAIAAATALAAEDGPLDPREFCSRLSVLVGSHDPDLASAIEQLPAWVAEPLDLVADWVRRVGLVPDFEDDWHGISPFVTGSVLWSLYSFLESPDAYWPAIGNAIRVGGDVDTTAAMTGAIAGARVGLQGIPSDAARLVTDRGTWEHDDLVRLAHQLEALHERFRSRPTAGDDGQP